MRKVVLFVCILSLLTGRMIAQKENIPISIPKGYSKLVFQDEFDGEGLPDKSRWEFEEGYVRNREKQYYTVDRTENAYQKGGCLHLTALNDSAVINGVMHPVTAASIHTKNTFAFRYGRVEVRAKLPFCLGTWPAIWLMPAKSVYGHWPKSGEIDIMEHVGYEPEKIYYAIHTQSTKTSNVGKGSNVFCPDSYTDFHVYALEWSEDKLEWHLDGKKRFVIERPEDSGWESWPFDQPFYLILNLAFGGGWGGLKGIDPDSLPQEYSIDYVRIFQ